MKIFVCHWKICRIFIITKNRMIKDEELWLSALQERNNVTHSYNRKIAMGIITQAKQKFYKMFCELKEEIDRNWI